MRGGRRRACKTRRNVPSPTLRTSRSWERLNVKHCPRGRGRDAERQRLHLCPTLTHVFHKEGGAVSAQQGHADVHVTEAREYVWCPQNWSTHSDGLEQNKKRQSTYSPCPINTRPGADCSHGAFRSNGRPQRQSLCLLRPQHAPKDGYMNVTLSSRGQLQVAQILKLNRSDGIFRNIGSHIQPGIPD